MSNPIIDLREECQRLLEESVERSFPELEMPAARYTRPPEPEMGELSSPVCFKMARILRQSPKHIADRIVENMDTSVSELVKDVDSIAGYINYYIDVGSFAERVFEVILSLDRDYGFLKTDKPERVMVEHTSANPNGPIHIGNARNSILGSCLASMLDKRGNDVVVHFLVNDMGRQVAMATYGWRLLGKPEPEGRAEVWVGTIYASVNVVIELNRLKDELRDAEERGRAHETWELKEAIEEYKVAAGELRKRYPGVYDELAEKIPERDNHMEEIVAINTAYEDHEPEAVEDVRTVVDYCLMGFENSLGEMGITFDSFDYESDLVWRRAAEEVLEELQASGYVSEEEGALILDCDAIAEDMRLKERWGLNPEHEIPRLVLVRGDGTTLYTLRDIAYSIWKFGFVDRVINVIGYEQTLAQLQLRIALAAMGKTWMGDRQLHYSYEFVILPGVKMSGRLGRYVTLLDVNERARELAYQEVESRSPNLPEDVKKSIARMVGFGAVKYTLLSVDPSKTVTFDWAKALNFETNSAPFIQYSHARACSILKNIDERQEPDYAQLGEVREKEILMALATWPEVFENSARELKPADIAFYCNDLSDRFNSFYASHRVLNAETAGLIGARLALVDAVRIVLRNALGVLGIEAPERM